MSRSKTRIYEESVSLSFAMARSAPTSPLSDKKYVHFAEGEDLVNIKTFVPSYDDLDALRKVFLNEVPLETRTHNTENGDLGENETKFKKLKGSTTLLARRVRIIRTLSNENDCLSACYDKVQPEEVEAKVKQTNVCLADTRLSGRTVSGFVIVNNLAFDKTVMIRYTFDQWKTFSESQSYYVSSADGTKRDKFGFNLTFPNDKIEMHFAIQYKVDGNEFWDNNSGNNYKIVDFS